MKKWNELNKKSKKQRLNELEPYIGFNIDNIDIMSNFYYYFNRYEQEKDKKEIDLDKAREILLVINNNWFKEILQ